ncbi:hypothetical protein ENSA7_80820 [Enhygromyxa salina]|uniref:Uncharacterized protein n=2 Tax=Enhygromyxa salina TaxID=215803 RepID=A0A2S9XL95_9BACT|nr:hypothetical protein ENSA7_80820 [Enhygromyxa salina]
MPVTACWIIAVLLAPPTEEASTTDPSAIVIYHLQPEDLDQYIVLHPEGYSARRWHYHDPPRLVEVRRTFIRDMMHQAAGMLVTPLSRRTDQG